MYEGFRIISVTIEESGIVLYFSKNDLRTFILGAKCLSLEDSRTMDQV